MKLKEVTIGASYTYQPQAYHSARGEAAFTVELDEGEELADVESELRDRVIQTIVRTLAGVDVVHEKVGVQGLSPGDLVEQDPGDEILGDDDEKWQL